MNLNESHTRMRRALRRNSTRAEKLFWIMARDNRLKHKFRRQYSIGTYIVDFYCHELKLVVEIDGFTHEDRAVYRNDIERQKYLENRGFVVKRYTDGQVLQSTESVYNDLKGTCERLASLRPSP